MVGDLEMAVEYMGRAVQLKPDNADAHYNLANALRKQGNLDEAVACYRRALILKPDNADAHSNLGNALNERGKLDEAVACYRRRRLRAEAGLCRGALQPGQYAQGTGKAGRSGGLLPAVVFFPANPTQLCQPNPTAPAPAPTFYGFFFFFFFFFFLMQLAFSSREFSSCIRTLPRRNINIFLFCA